jgi:hypothetical protein
VATERSERRKDEWVRRIEKRPLSLDSLSLGGEPYVGAGWPFDFDRDPSCRSWSGGQITRVRIPRGTQPCVDISS